MGIFDPAIFDPAIFDTGAVATATTPLTGHWRGPARGGRRSGLQGRIRLLSELDAPVFAQEIVEQPIVIDAKAIEAAAFDTFGKYAEAARLAKLRQDDDDSFIMMM